MPIQEHQDPRFWNYVHQYLYSIRLNTKSIKQTTGIQNLDSYSYLSESFVYPPYGEQIMIANFLDEKTKQVDKAIANKERLITLLEEERISLISHAVMKGLDPNIPLVDSDIPWIGKFPKHWKLAKLKDLAKVELSNIDKKTKDNESQILLCNYVDVYYHELITNEIDFMEATAPNEKISKFSLKAGNVIITKDSETPDDIAVPAYVPETLPGVVCGYHLAQISPLQGVINGKYLFRSFQSSGIKNQFEIFAHGITRYGISKYDIKNSFFLVPPFTEQIKIADYIDKKCLLLDNSINNNRRQIKLLKEYRSAIISALVKGKI
jgi:type I restriction enzyme S subunit